jgi:uncharacterized protein DUF3806
VSDKAQFFIGLGLALAPAPQEHDKSLRRYEFHQRPLKALPFCPGMQHLPVTSSSQAARQVRKAEHTEANMSEQKIEPPSEVDIDDIARAIVHAHQVIEQATGSKMDGTRNDLVLIQAVIDQRLIEREATYTLQALGLAFGRTFIHENENFDWWMVEDEYGRDPAIRYKRTSLLAFPRTMLSKRIEDGELPDAVELFDSLTRRLEELAEDGWDAS